MTIYYIFSFIIIFYLYNYNILFIFCKNFDIFNNNIIYASYLFFIFLSAPPGGPVSAPTPASAPPQRGRLMKTTINYFALVAIIAILTISSFYFQQNSEKLIMNHFVRWCLYKIFSHLLYDLFPLIIRSFPSHYKIFSHPLYDPFSFIIKQNPIRYIMTILNIKT